MELYNIYMVLLLNLQIRHVTVNIISIRKRSEIRPSKRVIRKVTTKDKLNNGDSLKNEVWCLSVNYKMENK
jgi:hypothetical protein